VLAVKETFPAVGRRPRDFYRQIAEFKNVEMIEPLELGLECVKRAEAVLTICGTAGFEGAVLGKPVVTVGQHNSFNFLPHVFRAKTEQDLAAQFRRATSPDFDSAAAQESGSRFLEAVVSRSFNMEAYDYGDVESYNASSVGDAVQSLVRGLAAQECAPHSRDGLAEAPNGHY
jgi:hypothetical protein